MIEIDQVVTARDWKGVEGKRYVVAELFDSPTWGPVARVVVWEWGATTVPVSRVIPVELLTVDAEETALYRRWRAGEDVDVPPL